MTERKREERKVLGAAKEEDWVEDGRRNGGKESEKKERGGLE